MSHGVFQALFETRIFSSAAHLAEELETTNKIALFHNSCDSEPAAVINQNKNSNMFLIRNVWGFDDYDNKEVSENELKAIIKEKNNIH